MYRFLTHSLPPSCYQSLFSLSSHAPIKSLSRISLSIPRARNIFIPLSTHPPDHPLQGKECTLYIKGFLAKGEHADHFEGWQRGHDALVDTHQWGPIAHGYFWKSGDLPGSLVPYATLLTGAYHLLTMKKLSFTPQGIALTAAAEAAVIGGKFWYEFKKASETAKAHGPNLAAHIEEISQKYPYVRIVAHSLGCTLLVEALKVLPEKHKPHEIHLLAPVVDEDSLHHNIAKEHTYLYHCGKDFALQTASTLFYKQKEVVGLSGPSMTWQGLTPVDVSHHFGFFVHTNYKDVLDKIVVDHKKRDANLIPSFDLSSLSHEPVIMGQDPDLGIEWNNLTGAEFLAKLEQQLNLLEQEEELKKEQKNEGEKIILSKVEKMVLATVQPEDVARAKERNSEKKGIEGINVQAIVEESVQKIEGVFKKEVPELLQVGKAFLQNVKVLMESRKEIAKSMADAVLENVPLGKGKK